MPHTISNVVRFGVGLVDIINALMLGGAHADAENRKGKTPLILASEAGQVMAIQALVNVGARVERESSQGVTALIAAANAGQVRNKHLFSRKFCSQTGTRVMQSICYADLGPILSSRPELAELL